MKKLIYSFICLAFLLPSCKQQPTANITPKPFSAEGKKATVYTTADSSNLRLTLTDTLSFATAHQPLETEIAVFVNPDKTFQSFMGIGGAVTDASAEVFAKLPENKQQELLQAYYDKNKGIGYSLARTNINSCDFSSDMYTYIQDGDTALKTFDIQHDKKFKIPFLKKASEIVGSSFLLYASPWSPPAFMKDNNDMLRGGKLKPEFYESWARYYAKFIKAYEQEKLPIWGITLQNEPMAVQRWESCIYTAEEERDFLKNYLGPILQKEGLADKKIVVWDHNRDLITHRANTIFSDPEAAKYAWGIGLHWYETWTGGQPMFENVARVHESFPDKNILFTEGCVERFDTTRYQYWANAERYGRSMINDFNSGVVGWTDWNILLDHTGGPNHVGNFCFSPIHADTRKGELIYTPSYYYIGHFSKFIRPDAHRVSSVASRSVLLTTAFRNADGSMVTIVMNQSNTAIQYNLFAGNHKIALTILPHSIQSIVY